MLNLICLLGDFDRIFYSLLLLEYVAKSVGVFVYVWVEKIKLQYLKEEQRKENKISCLLLRALKIVIENNQGKIDIMMSYKNK